MQSVSYGFPGFGGGFRHTIGEGDRGITWRLVIRVADLATLAAIDASIRAAMRAGEGDLIDKDGAVYNRTVLVAHQPGTRDIIRAGDRNGWLRREDVLTFAALAPR